MLASVIRTRIALLAAALAGVLMLCGPASAGGYVQGDPTCDGEVAAPDIFAVLEYASSLGRPDCIASANVNCDERIDALDALLIAQTVADVGDEIGGCTDIGDELPPDGVVPGSGLDFETFGIDGAGISGGSSDTGDVIVGDNYFNQGRRGIIGFDLAFVPASATQATITLRITETRQDQYPAPGTIDGSPPFNNPEMGAVSVIHLSDTTFLSQAASAYEATSAGNDPGVLIADGAEPEQYVTIDVSAALRQAIADGHRYLAFRIQAAVETDDDSLNDTVGFWGGDSQIPEWRPVLEYDSD